jgi:hypothetical protein
MRYSLSRREPEWTLHGIMERDWFRKIDDAGGNVLVRRMPMSFLEFAIA